VTLKDIGEIFGVAYLKAATMSTAINSYKKTGIFPFNPNVFEDSDFMPAETTHISSTEIPPASLNSATIIPFNSDLKNTDPLVELLEKLPETLVDISNINFDINNVQSSCSNTPQMKVLDRAVFKNVSPKDVMPIPHRSNEENSIPKRKSLNRRKTVVLTSSPYKNELETKTKISETEVKRKLFKKNKLNQQRIRTRKRGSNYPQIMMMIFIQNACIVDIHMQNPTKGGFVVKYVRNGLICHVLGWTMKETPHSLMKTVCNFNF